MKQNNTILLKSYQFSLRIVSLSKYLTDKHEYILARQILRSGTSIGANVEETVGCHTRRDFLQKISIAYKETRETHYWLRLIRDAEIIVGKETDSMITDCEELLRILGSLQKTLKQSLTSQ